MYRLETDEGAVSVSKQSLNTALSGNLTASWTPWSPSEPSDAISVSRLSREFNASEAYGSNRLQALQPKGRVQHQPIQSAYRHSTRRKRACRRTRATPFPSPEHGTGPQHCGDSCRFPPMLAVDMRCCTHALCVWVEDKARDKAGPAVQSRSHNTHLCSGTLPYVTEIMATSRSSGEALRASNRAMTSSTPKIRRH